MYYSSSISCKFTIRVYVYTSSVHEVLYIEGLSTCLLIVPFIHNFFHTLLCQFCHLSLRIMIGIIVAIENTRKLTKSIPINVPYCHRKAFPNCPPWILAFSKHVPVYCTMDLTKPSLLASSPYGWAPFPDQFEWPCIGGGTGGAGGAFAPPTSQ